MRQTTFANLKIGEAPRGYYTDLLLALLDTDAAYGDGMCSHIRDLADIVLARAQLTVCDMRDLNATDFLAAYGSLAHARALVTDYAAAMQNSVH